MNEFLKKGREILSAQPFSSMMGAELMALFRGVAELSLEIRQEFKQNYGFVHGGVVSYLADNCLTFAGATVLGHCLTSEYKINYVNPSLGEKLIANRQCCLLRYDRPFVSVESTRSTSMKNYWWLLLKERL